MDRLALVDPASTRALRRAVLRPAWRPGAPLQADDDPTAICVAVLADDRPVSCCVLLPRPFPPRPELPATWQLRGMATVPERQGAGLGSRVLAAAVVEVEARGGAALWCDARTSAVAFYRQRGFTTEGAEFLHEESGIRHQRMFRPLG